MTALFRPRNIRSHTPLLGSTQVLALMESLSRIRGRLAYNRLNWWQRYEVETASAGFTVFELRPNAPPNEIHAKWEQIAKVVFLDGGLSSDQFYIYLAGSQEPIRVPTESKGGNEFWEELRGRGLFLQEVSELAVRSTARGTTYEWPPSQSP